MLSHQFYNVVHIVGIVLLFAALGGAALLAAERGAVGNRAGGTGERGRRA